MNVTGPRERPILFSGPMVRAILEGRKTETRRVVKTPQWSAVTDWEFDRDESGRWWPHTIAVSTGCMAAIKCPFGEPGDQDWRRGMVPEAGWYHVEGWDDGPVWLIPVIPGAAGEEPGINWGWHPGDDPEAIEVEGLDLDTIRWKRAGDRLWVRETFAVTDHLDSKLIQVKYPADRLERWIPIAETTPVQRHIDNAWLPSIHMPRWASRILLEVTGVRVERLQEIDEDGARAEGVEHGNVPGVDVDVDGDVWAGAYRKAFRDLWDRINGKRHPWESNPWVWVVSFRVLRPAGKEAAA